MKLVADKFLSIKSSFIGMNRSQWFVFGVGFILMGFFFNYIVGITDCSAVQNMFLDIVQESSEADLSEEFIQTVQSSGDAWSISCFDKEIDVSIVSATSFTLGALFVINGFLEPKKKH